MGAKGGVGKSLFSIALIQLIGNDKVFLIDTDKSNPDVFMSANGKINATAIELTDIDGHSQLVEIIEANLENEIVINTRAANDDIVSENFDMILDFAESVDKTVTIWWVVNSHIDSVKLLKKFLEQFGSYKITINVVINKYFGKPENFSYIGSNTAKELDARGAKVIIINKLSTGVENAIYKERKLFSDIINGGKTGDKLSANKFMRELKEQLV
jgi:hypothetical protein